MRFRRSTPRVRPILAALGLVAGVLVVPIFGAPAASAAPGPVMQPGADMATDDVLPTVQINGVAWSQAIVGSTVYVGGSFTTAMSAATDPVQTSTPRANLLAYDLNTGQLRTSFDLPLNNQAVVLAKSPDGSRLYIGGDFTTIAGTHHQRLAAIDTATGQVIASFKPQLDARVAAIAATDTTVYVGGNLTTANGVARTRLAAFNAVDGSLTGWAPVADSAIKAMTLTPDGSKLILGGQFTQVNGTNVYGLAAVSPVDGALLPWAATGTVRAYGANAAITALRTDGKAVFGTAYTFGGLPISGLHEFEGTFSADSNSGVLNWLEDCHGDSYDVYSTGSVVYNVSHAHWCSSVGGFPQTALGENRRALAWTAAATGTLNANTVSGYKNWVNTPSPGMVNWFPDLDAGTYTGQSQAAWTVTGSGPYIVMGGEFPTVNGQVQQGLVRFATRPTAPGSDGPRAQGSNLVPTLVPLGNGTVRVQFQTSWDRDDKDLTYKIVRNSNKTAPIATSTVSSTWWNRPLVNFNDTDLTPGATYTYRIYASDDDGNQVQGDLVSTTAPGAGSPYLQQVAADQPSQYFRLAEPSGTSIVDYIGYNDLTAAAGVTRGVAGAIVNDTDTASHFSGTTTGFAAGPLNSVTSAGSFSIEGWVRTTSSSGGTVVNFGNKNSGNSTSVDRVLYLDNTGHVLFGVNNGSARTISSTGTYRDGAWHHVAATLGADGMDLYVDGYRVATRPDAISAATLSGYWRVGGDNLSGWSGSHSSNYLNGDIDEVAIYPKQLSAQTVAAHAALGGKSVNLPAAPADAYGATVFNDNPELFWRFAETSGVNLVDSSLNGANAGKYSGVVTLNQSGALVGNLNPAVKFNGLTGFAYSNGTTINPATFTEEAWFKTTTTLGGKILGLANSQTGTSSQPDRQIYMANTGKIVFGVGASATISSPSAYNDGLWHHVVASFSPNTGMNLFMDGALVGSGAAVTPTSTTGYWRVGGDTTGGSSSKFLNGTIDEVAVYFSVLNAGTVLRHYQVGTDTTPNTPPVAAFTTAASDLTVTVDGTSSTDPDGSVASYSWNWGDGSPDSTGPHPVHAYGATGTYSVTLTVTDTRGATNAVSHDVSVLAANQLPTAAFTSQVTDLRLSVDGSGSNDPDGSVSSYLWNWGDGTAAGSGATASHTYGLAGTFTVTVTVTDNRGGIAAVSQDVTTALPPNQDPTAAFTPTITDRSLSVNGTASADPDGTISSYSWDWGDGTATGSGSTATHSYAVAGTYSVTLTVTDNRGGTAVINHDVVATDPPNQSPVAAFSTQSTLRSVAANGSASSDPDGSIASYSWDWGDNSPADSGAAPTHLYGSDGTYTITLTVTDNAGATGTTSKNVTVTNSVASDVFGRTVAGGWGSADVGGTWTLSSASKFAVNGSAGLVTMSTAGSGPTASLSALSARDVDGFVDFAVDKPATGGGAYSTLMVRRVGTSNYNFTVKFLAGGAVTVAIAKSDNGIATTLGTALTVPGLTYSVGDVVRVRFQAIGTGTTTLAVKVWKVGTTEPAAFQLTKTDSTASVQGAGSFGMQAYLSGSSTNAPVVASFDNLAITTVGP